jgi:hypothetical protein
LIKYCLLTLPGQAMRAFYLYLYVISYFLFQQSTVNLYKTILGTFKTLKSAY